MTEVRIGSNPPKLPAWTMTYGMKLDLFLAAFRFDVERVDLSVVVPS